MKLQTKLIRGSWWIVGDADTGPMGPYENTKAGKAEAEDDRLRWERFEQYEDKPGYVTGDSLKGKRR